MSGAIAAVLSLALGQAPEPWTRPVVYQTPKRLQQAPSSYRFPDPVTTVHETTHWLNSQLRMQYRGGAYYLGQGRFLWVRRKLTRPTLGQVAQRMRYRGRLFQLYLEQSRHPLQPRVIGPGQLLVGHEDDPLFLFDEFGAYVNGAATAMQYAGTGYRDRVQAALEMGYYAAECLHAAPAQYGDRRELARIWLYQAHRAVAIAQRARRTGRQHGPDQASWLSELRRQIQRAKPLAR